jgi:hypothetical protein
LLTQTGQAHEDGPLYISHVAILSLQSALMMEIYEKPFADKKKLLSLYLEPRNYPSSLPLPLFD